MERFGEEEGGREVSVSETELGGSVFESPVLQTVVAVPATSCKTSGVSAEEAGCVPLWEQVSIKEYSM
jgi:hypothetical protein